MRHDTDIQRAPAGHKNWGDKGEGGDSPDRRHNYDREPGSGSGSSRDNRLELQRGNSIIGIVLPKCQASAQAPAAWPVCVIMIDLEIFTVRKHD